jgi:hypothetical protein
MAHKPNGELKIERDVPMPTQRASRNSGLSAVIKLLQPTESVLVPGRTAKNIGSIVHYVHLQHPDRHFMCRTVDGGARIWRVK